MISDPTDSTIDFQSDDQNSSGLKVDASVLTLAAVFGAVAFPPDMPEYLKAAILDRAERDRDAAGDFVIDNRMNPNDAKVRQAKADADEDDNLSQFAQIVRQDRQQREHERLWMEAPQTYAGQTMSGAEWRSMIDWFRDDTHVAAWEDAMMAETGQSREEVRQTCGKMKRFYDLMDKDAKGTLSKDERSEFDTFQRDKEVRLGVEVQREIQGLRPNHAVSVTARNGETLDGRQAESARSAAMTFRDDTTTANGLAAVQPLSPTYREAASGTPAPLPTLTKPSLSPAQTIQVSPDNMFG